MRHLFEPRWLVMMAMLGPLVVGEPPPERNHALVGQREAGNEALRVVGRLVIRMWEPSLDTRDPDAPSRKYEINPVPGGIAVAHLECDVLVKDQRWSWEVADGLDEMYRGDAPFALVDVAVFGRFGAIVYVQHGQCFGFVVEVDPVSGRVLSTAGGRFDVHEPVGRPARALDVLRGRLIRVDGEEAVLAYVEREGETEVPRVVRARLASRAATTRPVR